MKSDRKLALDTETTGLSIDAGDRVIEVACIEVEHGIRTGNEYQSYLNPQGQVITKDSLAIHGISSKFLEDKPVFGDVAEEFLEFVRGGTLLVHNATFDIPFLNHELSLCGRREKLEDICEIIDTLVIARQRFPGAHANLTACCNRFGIDTSARSLHGARLDANLVVDLYVELQRTTHTNLLGDVEKLTQVESVTADFSSTSRKNVVVVHATEEEQAAHDEFMAQLSRDLTNP